MENLVLAATKYTPDVLMQIDGTISLKGKSYPENTFEFYKPVIEWLKTYFETESCNFSISHGIAILMERSRMMVGNGGIVLISDTRSIKYCQKEIPSLRQVFFRLTNVSRH